MSTLNDSWRAQSAAAAIPAPGEVWIHDRLGEVEIVGAWGTMSSKVIVKASAALPRGKQRQVVFNTSLHREGTVTPRVRKPAKRRKHPLEAYKKWWLGNRVRRAGDTGPFKLVMSVEFIGPPSGVYGSVELRFDDGTRCMVSSQRFRPRKTDVEIHPTYV